MRRRKKKKKTMDVILVIIALFLLIFTSVMIFCIYKTGGSYDVLIEKVFMACVGEGGFMGIIQVAKIVTGEKKKSDFE